MIDSSGAVLAISQIVNAVERKAEAPQNAVDVLEGIIASIAREAAPIFAAHPPTTEYPVPYIYTNPGQYVAEAKAAGKEFLRIVDFLKRTIAGYEQAGNEERQQISNEIVGSSGIPALKGYVAQMVADARASAAKENHDFLPTEPFDLKSEIRKIQEKLDVLLGRGFD